MLDSYSKFNSLHYKIIHDDYIVNHRYNKYITMNTVMGLGNVCGHTDDILQNIDLESTGDDPLKQTAMIQGNT